ncbi:MAG: 16S rRNA (cytosine(1402)-N(4))-methyltransferase RsmH [Candidatus Beckwithbacteria bacterium]
MIYSKTLPSWGRSFLHQPVLLQLTLKLLQVKAGEAYLDCTLGSAGHGLEIVIQGGHLYGLDIDPDALKRSKARLEKACPHAFVKLLLLNFSQLTQAAKAFNQTEFSGILMDLGLSSEQLADPNRGFSFQQEGLLDMRADPSYSVKAADLVNGLNQGELKQLFLKLGEEPHAAKLADLIVKSRLVQPITTTKQLADLCLQAFGRSGRIHPATRIFQALRIAVNDELNNLTAVLPQAVNLLKSKGHLAVISFHSLEDRIVKNFMKSNSELTILTKKPLTPTKAEIKANPRSRSAKLRVAQKI